MSILKATVVTLALLLMPVHQFLYAEDDDELILLYNVEKSVIPKIAIDENTGATAIVWSNYTATSESPRKVFITFYLKDKKGTWRISPPKVVSSPGRWGIVTFNSSTNKFFVVWDGDSFDRSLNSSYENIRGRAFNLKGKPAGGIVFYRDAGLSNSSPYLVYNDNDNQYLLIWWRSYWLFLPGPSGLLTATLDQDGEMFGEEKKIRDPIIFNDGQWITETISGTYNNKSNIFMFVVMEDSLISGTVKSFYYLYCADKRGNLIRRIRLNEKGIDPGSFTWYSSISGQNASKKAQHLMAWHEEGKLKLRKITKMGTLSGGTIFLNNISNAKNPSIAYSPNHDNYLLVCSEKNGLIGRFLDHNCKIIGDSIKISNNGNAVTTVEWNAVINKYMVVWIESSYAINDKVWLSTISPPETDH